ncbi:MAG: LysR family transcriptional regulator [Alteromonadaceae bacterium]|nr:LysR family transcriptional regulator [Alteromonadaceae bacterium]
MTTDLNELLFFTKVIECGGFTAASKRLNVTKATVSRKVADLEKRLGVRLLNRTTRQLNLTEIGNAFYLRCSKIINDLDDAQSLVTTQTEQVKGQLKIVMPVEIGQLLLGEFIGHFLQKYPNVQIDAELTNRKVDMLQEGIDIYIRIGLGQDPKLIARHLGDFKKILVATPHYLAAKKTINHPNDLSDHECIILKQPGDSFQSWQFKLQQESVIISPKGRLQCNNITFLREALLSGLGVGYLPYFLALPHINDGSLCNVLEKWNVDSAKIYALYQSRQYMPKLLKTFLDEMSKIVMDYKD